MNLVPRKDFIFAEGDLFDRSSAGTQPRRLSSRSPLTVLVTTIRVLCDEFGSCSGSTEELPINGEATMPGYLLLLYAAEVDDVGKVQRQEEMPAWRTVTESLREAGTLVANARLQPVTAATTVRVRDDVTALFDGPFATTKEILVGFYLLECADLDEALRCAARLPLARYGSVEVRPVAPA